MPDNHQEPSRVEVETESVKHLRPGLGWIFFGAALAVVVASFMLIALQNVAAWSEWTALHGTLQTIISYGFILTPILAGLSVFVSLISFPPEAKATLRAGGDGLQIKTSRGRTEWIPRDRLVSGLVVPSSGRLELALKRDETIVAAIPSEYNAEALLSALGIDGRRRRVAVRLGTVQGQIASGCFIFVLTFFGMLILLGALDTPDMIAKLILPGLFPLVALLILRSVRPLEVIVGTDGIGLRRPWSRQFIRYSSLNSVEINRETRLELKLQSGRTITIDKGDEPERRALLGRIRMAMGAQGDGSTEGRAELELLEPRGLSPNAWREALKGLVARPGDYRRAGISEELLLSVVEDPDAAPERRIGAAIALRASGHKEAAPRIRVAAEACASERVKEALEQAAEDELDDATLERALKEAEAAKRA